MKTNDNRSQAATQSQFTLEDVPSSVPIEEDASLVNSTTTLVDDETVNQDRPSGEFVSQDSLSLVPWHPSLSNISNIPANTNISPLNLPEY